MNLSIYSIIKYFLLFYCLVTIVACTNLDQEVTSDLTPDNFFQTEEELITAIGPAYISLYGYMGETSLWAAQELTSDEMVLPMRGPECVDTEPWIRLHQHAWTPQDPTIVDTWNFLFNGVSTCNRLIFELEELERNITRPFIGELRAIRAIYYLWLLDLYGNVPLITSIATDDAFPRTFVRESIFNFVESELIISSNIVSDKVDGTTYGRVNEMTIQAALAHLYLNAEVYKEDPEWPKAIAACDVIINSGYYCILPIN